MPLQYNPTDSRFLTVAQSRTNNGQKDIRIILDLPTNDFYSLDDDGNFNVIGASGGTQTLADVLDIGNVTGPNPIIFDEFFGLIFDNNSRLQEGTIDAGLGGNKGIAQICGLGYELKWEGGVLYVMGSSGNTIRQSLFNFNILPTIDDDITKGYYIGTRWTLDDNVSYICADNTTGAAVWNLVPAIDYTEYVAFVSQSGATAPTAVVEKNDTTFTFTYGYSSLGSYTITAIGAFPNKGKVIPYFNSQTNQGFTTIGWTDADNLYVITTDTSAVLTNGQFEGNLVIRIYN